MHPTRREADEFSINDERNRKHKAKKTNKIKRNDE